MIARKAALSRWEGVLPQATHDGSFSIGDSRIVAAVLPNGKRLLSQGTFLRAMGRSRTPKAGTGGLTTVDELPFFLQAEVLKPHISEELRLATIPVQFRMKDGKKAIGYEAQLLPMVCRVYLDFRDACIQRASRDRTPVELAVPRAFRHIVPACDILTRALAQVGIAGLVDEATGYQEVRDRRALEAILDRFLRKELAAWAKRFPDEFYMEVFRLKGWEWKGMSVNRPSVVGKYTNDLVYDRLAPNILTELEARNPKDERGNRKHRHHQWLTEDVGHPVLAQHLYAVIGFMRACTDWESFYRMMQRAFPKKNTTMLLPGSDVGL
ncbi:MAG: P63C domain-containing protein [Acidobacteria bacterium]|nr:P63C domain-containing protein [Acidobacteriota bacterium]